MRGNETEPWIVLGMTDDNYSAISKLFATRQTLAHQCRADAFVLVIRRNSHWCEPHHVQVGTLVQGHRRKGIDSPGRALSSHGLSGRVKNFSAFPGKRISHGKHPLENSIPELPVSRVGSHYELHPLFSLKHYPDAIPEGVSGELRG